MKTKTIKQTVLFGASPKEVYDLIMESKKHKAFTGGVAKMSKKVKGKFETYDGYCYGYNIELKEGKKIVQAWGFKENNWPEKYFSNVTFVFDKAKNGTKLSFTHSGVPAENYKSLKTGWQDYYWAPMKNYLSSLKVSKKIGK